MPEVLRKTITFRGHTSTVDGETATELLDRVANADNPAGFGIRKSADGNADETSRPDERLRVVVADHEPATDGVLDADATVFTVTYDEAEQQVDVAFRANAETVEACTDLLEHVLDVTAVETGTPPGSGYFLDVQLVLDSHVEPYHFSPPDGMLFRTKRTHDGQTALRLVRDAPLALEESARTALDDIERGLSLVEQI